MNRKYRATKRALCMLGAAVILQLVEYEAGQRNMEFRTFLQVIKGIYNWLIVPLTLVFSLYYDFLKGKTRFRLRYLGPVLLTIFIVGAALFRGLIYSFEMASEEMTEEGMIRGKITGFWGSRYIYYEPVLGVFRTPFRGWNDEKIAAYLEERYGEGMVLVETESDGTRIYQAPGAKPGSQPFYFCVWNGYEIEDNFEYSLIKSDASGFWKNDRKRQIYFMDSYDQKLEAEEDGEWSTQDCPQNKDRLVVCCYSREDVKPCAADLADWIFYEYGEGRYSDRQSQDDTFYNIYIKYAEEKEREFMFNIKQEIKENNWAGLCQGIEIRLGEYAKAVEERKDAEKEEAEDGGAMSLEEFEEWAAGYMENYRGDFEKEIFLPDGVIGYRMVVMDAALGNRAYGLLKSVDGGKSWQIANYNPFDTMGMGVDFTFLDENFGFATLMHQGGDEAELYVTEDGGKSYEHCMMQGLTVTLEDGYTYNPYDYPQMPFEESGKVYVLCGQGMDGDYNGGDAAWMALFESADHGHTFSFKEMQEGKEQEY